MGTFLQAQIKAKAITPSKFNEELFRFIKSIENEIFDLNVKQIENAEDAQGNPLINKDSRFSGVYTQLTEDIAAIENPVLPKKAGELYNFAWSGDFLSGFKMDVFTDHVDITSTGDGGNDEKKAFFEGYQSLYGLTPESIRSIANERILPFCRNFYRTRLVQ